MWCQSEHAASIHKQGSVGYMRLPSQRTISAMLSSTSLGTLRTGSLPSLTQHPTQPKAGACQAQHASASNSSHWQLITQACFPLGIASPTAVQQLQRSFLHRTSWSIARSSITCSASSKYITMPGETSEDPSLSAAELNTRLGQLSRKVSQELGIPAPKLRLNHNIRLNCPFCQGGINNQGGDQYSFSLFAVEGASAALYNCFRATCGMSGRVGLTGRHSQSKSHEVKHTLDDAFGKKMLSFFEERGISREALEACGVYSAMVKPPSVLTENEQVGEVDSSSSSSSSSSNWDPNASVRHGEDVGDDNGPCKRVHCAVMPYRNSEGKEVSRTYMYLEAIEVEEARQGRTPIQLRSPPWYTGPKLGEPCPLSRAVSLLQQQQQQQQQQRQQQQSQEQQQEQQQVLGQAEHEQQHCQSQRTSLGPEAQDQQRAASSAIESLSSSSSSSIGPHDSLPNSPPTQTGPAGSAQPSCSGSRQASLAAKIPKNQPLVDFFMQLVDDLDLEKGSKGVAMTAKDEVAFRSRRRANIKMANIIAAFPLEVNRGSLNELTSIPGVGEKSTEKIKKFLEEQMPQEASSVSGSEPQGMEPATAIVPENQELVSHLQRLNDQALREAGPKYAASYKRDVQKLSKHSKGITMDDVDDLGLTHQREVYSFLSSSGPNAALISALVHHPTVRLLPIAKYPKPITLDDGVLKEVSEVYGIGARTMKTIKGVLESFKAGAPQPESAQSGTEIEQPSHPAELQPTSAQLDLEQLLRPAGTQPAPTQSDSGWPLVPEAMQLDATHVQGPGSQLQQPEATQLDATHIQSPGLQFQQPEATQLDATHIQSPDSQLQHPINIEGPHRGHEIILGTGSSLGGTPYRASNISRPDPVLARSGSPAAAALPSAAAAGTFDVAQEGWSAAQVHLDAGLPCTWHTGAGPKRTLWGVHDVVSFLAASEANLAMGRVREEDCLEGSGEGDTYLYLYLVEDELDRLSMIMLGLGPHVVLCLPPNIRRDFKLLCEEKQRHKMETVMMPCTSDLIKPRNFQAKEGNSSRARHGIRGAPGAMDKAEHDQGERAVLSCVTSVADSVFAEHKCGRVYLALRNVPLAQVGRDSGELEDELAGILGKERCARISWPNSIEKLPNTSPHSPDYNPTGSSVDVISGTGALPQDTVADSFASSATTSSDASNIDPSSSSSSSSMNNASSATNSTSAGSNSSAPQAFNHGYSAGSATGTGFGPSNHPLRLSANEVLIADGLSTLLDTVQYKVTHWPVDGLFQMNDFLETIIQNYRDLRGFSQGESTGWPYLDRSYRVVPGELTIVTGVPNSGKSEWLDALCMNLAEQAGWAIAMCSFEKYPQGHARNLLEKRARKPFSPGAEDGSGNPIEAMSMEELLEGMNFLDTHFLLIRHSVEDKVPIEERELEPTTEIAALPSTQDASPTIDWVLAKAEVAKRSYGIRGLVIDPYNELDHFPRYESETEYVSQMLSKIKRFAQHNNVHVWLVTHPRQQYEFSSNRPPHLYDISGSAHFYNKADAGIVVHRPSDASGRREAGPDPSLNPVHIFVRKMRNKAAGKQGECVLLFDHATGIYSEPDPEKQEEWKY